MFSVCTFQPQEKLPLFIKTITVAKYKQIPTIIAEKNKQIQFMFSV